MARARFDVNLNPTIIGVLNTDGQTPQEVYVTALGELVVNTTTAIKFSSSTPTTVGASVTSVTLKASNAARKELLIRNDSTSILYIEEGATATSSSAFKLNQDDYYRTDNYTGIVTGIWVSAVGNAQIKES
jgi:CCR4-NOT transcriptional regulation complex NOT5 subunit